MPTITNFILMLAPDTKIIDFIKEHHVLTIATSSENKPYISHCFYAFSEEENYFVFSSDKKTRHSAEILANQKIAAGIVLETKMIGKIQGLQITGKVSEADDFKISKAKNIYLKAFPYALLHLETLWIIEPDFYKLTDNRLGFGKKIIWQKTF